MTDQFKLGVVVRYAVYLLRIIDNPEHMAASHARIALDHVEDVLLGRTASPDDALRTLACAIDRAGLTDKTTPKDDMWEDLQHMLRELDK